MEGSAARPDPGVLGDNGELVYTGGTLSLVRTLAYASDGAPVLGKGDTIYAGTGNDIILGGSGGDTIRAGAGNDLVLGDQAKLEGEVDGSALPWINDVSVNALFTVTPTEITDNAAGGHDFLYGEDGHDILIAQQGNDEIWGGGGDDDIIGGHSIAGGYDGHDRLDGGSGRDVIAGDNAEIVRIVPESMNARYRVLTGTVMYDDNGIAQVAANGEQDPTGAVQRRIFLFDHSHTIEQDSTAIQANLAPFGNDSIAGGADDDMMFGQLGDDIIQGDGSISLVVGTDPSEEAETDGDDYIEGNGGDDLMFGNLGQDDIIGGSSTLFGLGDRALRPDGADTIFGGAGTAGERNHLGDLSPQGHARDADTILGDNGNIFRLVGVGGEAGTGFLTFTYDDYATELRIISRAVQEIDYTPGGPAFLVDETLPDIGGADEIHGEAGDDAIHGMVGNDVLFGDGQNDDITGGWGHDWISGGTGEDGLLGDDGRIYTSRNGSAESLYGIEAAAQDVVATSGNRIVVTVYETGKLNKSVNLTPFHLDPTDTDDPLHRALDADDVIYGGWGNDFIHGGAGDDAVSGAEALAAAGAILVGGEVTWELGYDAPSNPGGLLEYDYDGGTGTFGAYDANDPRLRIVGGVDGTTEFFLNFNAGEGEPIDAENGIYSDGDDVIFGDLGNDWMVGGTGMDHLYGGWGNDLMNADDDLSTAGVPDDHASYADIAYGGAGRDVLIGNYIGDRLIDWNGEFNSYIVPFSQFGEQAIIRQISPGLVQFLYDLSKADGADQTRAADSDGDVSRNGEPDGELGLVLQQDAEWQEQTGAPRDPQPQPKPDGGGGSKTTTTTTSTETTLTSDTTLETSDTTSTSLQTSDTTLMSSQTSYIETDDGTGDVTIESAVDQPEQTNDTETVSSGSTDGTTIAGISGEALTSQQVIKTFQDSEIVIQIGDGGEEDLDSTWVFDEQTGELVPHWLSQAAAPETTKPGKGRMPATIIDGEAWIVTGAGNGLY